jgi:hypothetical protein
MMNCFGCRKTAARKAQRAFPFAESNLDAVKMRLFLDKELGDGSYRLDREADRIILYADQDLTTVKAPN